MAVQAHPDFSEGSLLHKPIRELGLGIAGTRLEPVTEAFIAELAAAGIVVRPRFYLSTEWGVPFGSISIAIPFYLAHPELAELHIEHTGMVEGFDAHELIRYLRHEMGHVLNYAYKLYERQEWVRLFGAITQPYVEEYRPQPFSPRFVRHLPGWYAQKHPDEDWAETFAVWMTPKCDWHKDYAALPVALAKLQLCDALVRQVASQPPLVVDDSLDEDVGSLPMTLAELYGEDSGGALVLPPGVDGALRAIFSGSSGGDLPAPTLLRRIESALCTDIYRWTGHFPERSRRLLRELGRRAQALQLTYAAAEEPRIVMALTVWTTALAMSFVQHGRYSP